MGTNPDIARECNFWPSEMYLIPNRPTFQGRETCLKPKHMYPSQLNNKNYISFIFIDFSYSYNTDNGREYYQATS